MLLEHTEVLELGALHALFLCIGMLFRVHLQEKGSGDDFFDVTREDVAFAVQMPPLLHYMKCRSWYLTSKTREAPNPLFSVPASCSVFSLTLPH